MNRRLAIVTTLFLALTATVRGQGADVAPEPLSFRVTIDRAILDADVDGRVYVLASQGRRDPRFGPGWFSRSPFFSADLDAVSDDGVIEVSAANARSYPAPFEEIAEGSYAVQAVVRLNPDAPNLGSAPGNAFSPVVRATFGEGRGGVVDLHVSEVVPERVLEDTERVKYVEIPSPMLTAFHGRPVTMRAAVILPLGYDDDPTRVYPVSYYIGGFGSDHTIARFMAPRWDQSAHGRDLVRVVLDAQCYGGHHVFADSANNGPRGTALVEELIPHLEAHYRIAPDAAGRFVTGHSSGGWTSLWLQIAYPDTFGGVWSTAPDPVDFRAYQLIDVYAEGANAYVGADGEPTAVATMRGGRYPYRDFVAMETVLGEGGQLRSFEWCFSPKGDDGRPMPLFDRETGAIDPAVAKAWQQYDIRLVLERNWDDLGPKLAGKLRVFAGAEDTFFLQHAVYHLERALKDLGSDAVIEVFDGADHGSFMTEEMFERIDREMVEAWERSRAAVPSG